MNCVRQILGVAMGVTLGVSVATGQTPAGAKPSFEVASIKAWSPANNAGNFMGIGRAPGGRFTANNVPLRFLIQNAYRVRDFQVIGGPRWMATDRGDVGAKAEEGSIPPQTGPPAPDVPY